MQRLFLTGKRDGFQEGRGKLRPGRDIAFLLSQSETVISLRKNMQLCPETLLPHFRRKQKRVLNVDDLIRCRVPQKCRRYLDGEKVTFSKKEFEILNLLASNPGKIFSREDLIAELWKDAPYVLDRTVDVHIARIRSKLGECKKYLVNRSGYGYIFNAID